VFFERLFRHIFRACRDQVFFPVINERDAACFQSLRLCWLFYARCERRYLCSQLAYALCAFLSRSLDLKSARLTEGLKRNQSIYKGKIQMSTCAAAMGRRAGCARMVKKRNWTWLCS
jgi:hypothetical protein